MPVVSLGILSGSQHGSSFLPSISFGFFVLCLYPHIVLCSSLAFSVFLNFFLGGVSLGILSGSPLLSPFLVSLFSSSLPLTPFSWLITPLGFGSSLSSASLYVFYSQSSPFLGQPGHTVRLAAGLLFLALHIIRFFSVSMYVSSYCTIVLIVLFSFSLFSLWWGQPGHTVRPAPSLPLFRLFFHLSFPSLLSLSLSLLFVFDSSLLSASPYIFIPNTSLLGPAWAYCPARPPSLPFSPYLCLSSPLPLPPLLPLPLLLLPKGVCPKRYRPKWQHLMTQSGLSPPCREPIALEHPRFAAAFLLAACADGAAYAAGPYRYPTL